MDFLITLMGNDVGRTVKPYVGLTHKIDLTYFLTHH